MGMSLVEQIDQIFAKPENNFDICGFCWPLLVAVERAEDLARMTPAERKELERHGYELFLFKSDGSEGLIRKPVGRKQSAGALKLYYDQVYPQEIVLRGDAALAYYSDENEGDET